MSWLGLYQLVLVSSPLPIYVGYRSSANLNVNVCVSKAGIWLQEINPVLINVIVSYLMITLPFEIKGITVSEGK